MYAVRDDSTVTDSIARGTVRYPGELCYPGKNRQLSVWTEVVNRKGW